MLLNFILMFVFMPQYMTWSKEDKGSNAYAEFRPLVERLVDELLGIGHPIGSTSFKDFGGRDKDYFVTSFLLADINPLAMVYIQVTRWTKSNHTEFLLGVRHFLAINKRFEKLEEIAARYGFKPNEPFSSLT
jgi:hypothetical protein